MERAGGWLGTMLLQRAMGAADLKDVIRRFCRFVDWIDINLRFLALEDRRQGRSQGGGHRG